MPRVTRVRGWEFPQTRICARRSSASTPAVAPAAARTGLAGGTRLAHRSDIEGLRGLAVGLVVAYHAFPGLRTGGFVGVDVFFVISGYLISLLILDGIQRDTFTLLDFYQRRARRILPALLVIMIACCLFGWLILLPSELQWLGRSLSWCAPFAANLYFATQASYFARAAELNPLLHLWSLGVEEQFYLVWPVLLILAVRYGVTMRVLTAVIVTSLAISIWGGWHAPAAHFYLPASRAWELASGAMLALHARRLAGKARSNEPPSSHGLPLEQLAAIAGLLLVLAGGTLWTAKWAVPGIWSTIPVAGTLLLIASGPRAALSQALLASRPMMLLGRVSYPLYLWHWPAFAFTRIILGHAAPPIIAVGTVALSIGAAYATFRFVEVPIRFGELRQSSVPWLLGGLAACALLGVGAANHRIVGRLAGPTVTAWDQAVNDWHEPDYDDIAPARLGIAGHLATKTLFVGDSHMQQYGPRIAYVTGQHPGTARSALLSSHSACPPLPGLDTLRPARGCDTYFTRAMHLAERPDIDTVVLAAFWEKYFRGEFGVPDSRDEIYRVADPARRTLGVDSPGTSAAFDQLEQAITALVRHGRRVLIVLSSPTSPVFAPVFPPQARFALHAARSFPLAQGPHIDVAPFEAFTAPVRNRLVNLAARAGARVIDPLRTLCPAMSCPSTSEDGLPLYLDSNHMGNTAARENASFLDETLLAERHVNTPPSGPSAR